MATLVAQIHVRKNHLAPGSQKPFPIPLVVERAYTLQYPESLVRETGSRSRPSNDKCAGQRYTCRHPGRSEAAIRDRGAPAPARWSTFARPSLNGKVAPKTNRGCLPGNGRNLLAGYFTRAGHTASSSAPSTYTSAFFGAGKSSRTPTDPVLPGSIDAWFTPFIWRFRTRPHRTKKVGDKAKAGCATYKREGGRSTILTCCFLYGPSTSVKRWQSVVPTWCLVR